MYFRFAGRHLGFKKSDSIKQCRTCVRPHGNGGKCRNCLWNFVFIQPGSGDTCNSGLQAAILDLRSRTA
jgi:hypothetical protein